MVCSAEIPIGSFHYQDALQNIYLNYTTKMFSLEM